MSIEKIIQSVKENSISNNDDWFKNLEPRKKEEVILHDKLRDMDFRKKISKKDAKKYFSNIKILDGINDSEDSLFSNNQRWFDDSYLIKNSISGLSESYFNNLIKNNSKDKLVLDMACGFGRESITAAISDAKLVVGIDLSPNSVKEGNELANKNNLNNVIFSVADCENLYFDNDSFDTTFIDTGSPHLIRKYDNINSIDIVKEATLLKRKYYEYTKGLNFNFCEISGSKCKLRTYERGVENETLSCGTGAVASAIFLKDSGLIDSEKIEVVMKGGTLLVDFKNKENTYSKIWLSGAVNMVFKGLYNKFE